MCGKIYMFLCVDTSQLWCSCCCPGCVGTEAAHIKPRITEMSDALSCYNNPPRLPPEVCQPLCSLSGEASESISPLTLQAVADNTSQLLLCYCKGLTQKPDGGMERVKQRV